MPICFQTSSRPSGNFRLPLTADAAEAFFERCQVVHFDAPAHPAAARCRAGPDGLPERSLVGCRVVQDLHDLQVFVPGERDNHVAGAETGVHPALHGFDAEGGRNTFGGGCQAILFTGVRDVIHAHAIILALCDGALS